MTDLLAPTRSRLASMCVDYERITKQLSKPVAFLHTQNENALNEQISDVFNEASNILKAASINIDLAPKEIETPLKEVTEFKKQIEHLSAELDRRTRSFDTSIAIARQIFNGKLDEIAQEYKRRLTQLMASHQVDEKKLEAVLKEIQQSFNERLQAEISSHVAERNRLHHELENLQNEYNITFSTLSTSLESAKMRVELLKKQKEMLEETNAQVTATITEKFKQQIDAMESQYAMHIQTLETEYKSLKDEMDASLIAFNKQMDALSEELRSIEEDQTNNVSALLNKQLLHFEKQKRKIQSHHQKKVTDITHAIELEEMSSSNQAKILRSEIEQQKQFLAESEERYNESLAALKKKTELELLEKENEMKMLEKMHNKTIKQLEQKHRLNLEQQSHDSNKIKLALEQKLQQTQKEGENIKKRLEAEVNALKRAKDRFEEEIAQREKQAEENSNPEQASTQPISGEKKLEREIKNKSGKTIRLAPLRDVVADIKPSVLAQNPEVEAELNMRINKFSDAGRMELAALGKALDSFDVQYRAEQELMQLQLDAIHRHHRSLEVEKSRLIKQVKDAQSMLEEIQKPKDKENKVRESFLNNKIASQHQIILQLKEDLQKMKSEPVKKVDISVIQAEHQTELQEMQDKLHDMEAQHQMKLKEITSQYEQEIKEEKERTKNILDKINIRYNQVMEEIAQTKEIIDTEFKKDHQKWMATRKEMADSNNKLLGVLNNNAGSLSRPTSSVPRTSTATRASPLPALKR